MVYVLQNNAMKTCMSIEFFEGYMQKQEQMTCSVSWFI